MDFSLHLPLWTVIGGVFLLAGAVKGISGMGLPTLSMALLSLALPPDSAAALMVLPSLVTNLAQCLGPHVPALVRRLWPLWLMLVVVTLCSPVPDVTAAGPATRMVLGVVLVVYGVWGLARPAWPGLCGSALGVSAVVAAMVGAIVGATSGALAATTGVFVIPLVPYLQALRLERDALMQALGLSFSLATMALALRLGTSGWAATVPLAGHAVALGAAFVGLGVGTRLRRHLSPSLFQRALHGVFIGLGMLMVGRAL